MRIAFFEDQTAPDFNPIALMRPVFELVCGHFGLRERVIRNLPVSEWGAFLRGYLTEVYREEHPEAKVNDYFWLEQGATLLLNGRWLPPPAALAEIGPDDVGLIDGTIAYLTLQPAEVPLTAGGELEAAIYQVARSRTRKEAPGRLLSRPWDLIEFNRSQISLDFASRRFPVNSTDRGEKIAFLGAGNAIHVDPTAIIDPFVVLDARQGPVSVEAGCVLQSFTRLEGPCHIGQGTHLFRANVGGGTTIGPVCRVGGELNAAILHGYVNKAHDGFLGNSYVCPWVNLGALTTNSNLKNDYSTVRIPLAGKSIDTGLAKVGCFIGDHTKTGLGSLLNTGSSVGVMCMLLPSGELLPKHIPSFTNIWHGRLEGGLPLKRSFIAATKAMERRNCELTPAQQRLLECLYQNTRAERDAAITQFREKNLQAPLFFGAS